METLDGHFEAVAHHARGFSLRRLVLGGEPGRLDGLLLTPNPNAARSYGAAPLSLEDLAVQMVGKERLVSPLDAHRFLLQAADDIQGGKGDPAGTARVMARAVRELLRAEADLEIVASVGRRAARLAAVARRYAELLAANGKLDSAQVFTAARHARGGNHRVSVVGYPRLGVGELLFLDVVAGEGSLLVLPARMNPTLDSSAEAETLLESRGWVIQREGEARRERPREPRAYRFPTVEGEVRGMLAEVKALLLGGTPPEEIALVVRDEVTYGPLLLAVAREYGLDLAAFYSVPLRNTSVGSFAAAAAEAIRSGFSYEATARYLAHPLRSRLDRATWARVRSGHPQSLRAWTEISPDVAELDWPEEAPWGAWRALMAHLLGRAAERTAEPRDQTALETLRGTLAGLSRPAEELVGRAQVLDELESALALLTVPVMTEGSLSLHTPLALFGSRRAHVFVLGVAEGLLPAPLSDDPALDFHERKRLRALRVPVETAAEAAQREALSFWAVHEVAQQSLTLSYPELLDGQPLRPSHVFRVLKLEPRVPSERYAASLQEALRCTLVGTGEFDHPVLQRARRAFDVEMQRESPSPCDRHDGVTGRAVPWTSRSFSATQLTSLLTCPFRWFAGYALGLAEAREHEDTPSFVGTLYHHTLEIAATRARGAADLRAAVLDELEGAWEEAEQREEVPELPAWNARRQEYLGVLRAAVEAQAFTVPGAQLVATEVGFRGTWEGFAVAGRIDRVDSCGGELIVTDYKSGSSVSGPDVQLPIYREVASAFFGQPVKEARYFSVGQGEVITLEEVPDLPVRLEAARTALDTGFFSPDPAERMCRYCEYDLLCRRGPRLSRKGAG
jgi:hypothetical protein